MTFYIGKEPTIGNYAKMDSISAVNGQATYNLLRGGSAFAPQSANHVICSLNSIIQNPGSSFTISGSQITFASNLQTGDSIDFILVLGDTLSIGVPSDDTIDSAKLKANSVIEAKIQNNAVTTDKINNDAVTIDKINLISTTSAPSLEAKGTSGQTDGYIQLNCEQNSHGIKLKSPSHSSSQSYTIIMPDNQIAQDKFMKVKSITGSGSTAIGQLEFADAGGANTPLFQASISSSFSLANATYQKINFDVETYDPSNVYDHTTNYRFTPAIAGYYFIHGQIRMNMHQDADLLSIRIYKNGSNIQAANIRHENYESVAVSAIDLADSDDYYEIYAYQNTGSSKDLLSGVDCRFFAFKLIS